MDRADRLAPWLAVVFSAVAAIGGLWSAWESRARRRRLSERFVEARARPSPWAQDEGRTTTGWDLFLYPGSMRRCERNALSTSTM